MESGQVNLPCIRWWMSFQLSGYGQIRRYGKTLYAHRYIYEECFGFIEDDVDVCHSCDNRWCVQPDHLFLGTRKDNMHDARKKGRLDQKLDDDKRVWIRKLSKLGYSRKELAEMFKVDVTMISKVKLEHSYD